MHVEERERLIVEAMDASGFVTYRALEQKLPASPATIRRDLARLEAAGRIQRVRGGARLVGSKRSSKEAFEAPGRVDANVDPDSRRRFERQSEIGEAAATLCLPGEGIMMCGGATTLRMCPHLRDLELQVLTNSLCVIDALLRQQGTRLLVPSGSIFPQQDVILAATGEDGMPRFHAPKLFMSASSVGPRGAMQSDMILVAAERPLIDKAEQVILLVDSGGFASPSGFVSCRLEEVDVIVTDSDVSDADAQVVERAGVRLVVA